MKLLRIEGVNIDATINDTDDLSTRRGSSLMLLQAVRDVAGQFQNEITPISTGASVGLFAIKDSVMADLTQRIRQYLHQHEKYRHMTFVVDEAQAQGFRSCAETVLAANRWQQMKSFSVSLDGLADAAQSACAKTGTRPGAQTSDRKSDGGAMLSCSVQVRREYGRKQRNQFYADEMALPEHALKFTDEFDTLTSGLDPLWGWSGNVGGKMAVFYADGNRFGDIARACNGEGELKQWDQRLKSLRGQWLANLLEFARNTRHWQTRNQEIRLETLLWGGDEFMLVVPAWCGLELAQHFVNASQGWESPPIDLDDGRGKVAQPLTHACGLVLCHHNAPIGPISQLTQSLADLGKADAQRNATSVHALVLESFDNAGGDLHALLATRFQKRLNSWSALTLTRARLAALMQHMGELKTVLPRSTLTRALRLLLKGETANALLKRSYASVHKATKNMNASAWQSLWQELSGQPWTGEPPADDASTTHLAAWAQILEFWDYIASPGNTDSNTEATQTTPQNVSQGAAA